MAARVFGGVTLLLILAACCPAIGQQVAEGQPPATPPEPKKIPVPYATAHDKVLEAKESVVSEADQYTQFRVEFNGIKGDRVPAFLYVPKSKDAVKVLYPAVLLQYGSGGNKTTDYIVSIGKRFASHGFVVLTIDSPGRGERKDNKSGPLDQISTEMVMHYCGDYSRAVDYLASRSDVASERIGYVGISWGAITGITFVAYEPRVKAMVSLVGGGNFLGLYNPKSAAKVANEGSKSSDPVYHVARIAPRPLLFINVTRDQLIFKSWAESLHKAAGPGSKVVWLETDHFLNGQDRNAVCDSVIDFMNKSLPITKATASK